MRGIEGQLVFRYSPAFHLRHRQLSACGTGGLSCFCGAQSKRKRPVAEVGNLRQGNNPDSDLVLSDLEGLILKCCNCLHSPTYRYYKPTIHFTDKH